MQGFADCVVNPNTDQVVCIGNIHSGNLFVITSHDSQTGEQNNIAVLPEVTSTITQLIYTGKDDNYLLIGTNRIIGPSLDSIEFFTKLIDKDLNIINESVSVYPVPNIHHIFHSSKIDCTLIDNNVVVLIYMEPGAFNVFFRLDLDGSIVFGPTDYFDDMKNGFSISPNPVDNTFRVIAEDSYSLTDSLEYIDGSENFREYFPLGRRTYESIPWGDNTLVATSSLFNQSGYDLGMSLLYLIDQNDDVIQTAGMTLEDISQFGYPAEGRPLAVDQDSNLYLVNVGSFFGDFPRGIFKIAKFDKDLNKIWEHAYSDLDNHTYWIFGALPKPSGGVILYGSRTSLQVTSNSFEGYMVSFDEEGNIISNTDNSSEEPFNISLSRSESNLELTFSNVTSGNLTFYTLGGQLLYSKVLYQVSNTSVETSMFPKQMLVISYHSENGKESVVEIFDSF